MLPDFIASFEDEKGFSRWLADALQGHGDDWSWAELAELMREQVEGQ